MRNAQLATFVATLWFLAGGAAFGQQQTPPRVSGGTAVAVIDINFIFKNHERFKQKMDEIKRDIEAFEGYLRDERNKITTQTEELKNQPAGSPAYKTLEESIAAMHTQLTLETGRKRKEILEREAKVYYNSYKEIEELVALFADRHGIGLVLRFNSEEMDSTKRESVLQGINRAVVFQRNLNITHLILDELSHRTPPARIGGNPRRPQVPGRPRTN